MQNNDSIHFSHTITLKNITSIHIVLHLTFHTVLLKMFTIFLSKILSMIFSSQKIHVYFIKHKQMKNIYYIHT